jgi:hypothetical protein
MPGPRQTRFEIPWESEEPEEIEAWKEESEIPAAWLPDLEPRRAPSPAKESPRELLERLARAAEAATEGRRAPSRAKPASAGDLETGLPMQASTRPEEPRMTQLRQRLTSPTSLREVLLLREILGPPRARRRSPLSYD